MPSSQTTLMLTTAPSNSRLQLREIRSNTGFFGGLAQITPSTSPSRRLLFGAALASLNSRAFSIAIAAWSANVWTSAI